MADNAKRPLSVFLCHASEDKQIARELYQRLTRDGIDVWFAEEKLLPGQDWKLEIPREVKTTDIVVVLVSGNSISKEGYIQKEIQLALDVADEKPEGTIYIVPVRLDDCKVPDRLSRWQWIDLGDEDGYKKICRSLLIRANQIGAVLHSQKVSLLLNHPNTLASEKDKFSKSQIAVIDE